MRFPDFVTRLSAGNQDWISERFIDVKDHSLETPVCWLRPLSFLSLLSNPIQLDVFHDRQRIRFSLSGESLRSTLLQPSFQIEVKSGDNAEVNVGDNSEVSTGDNAEVNRNESCTQSKKSITLSKNKPTLSKNKPPRSKNHSTLSKFHSLINTSDSNAKATITIDIIPPPQLSPPVNALSDNRIPVCVRSSSLPLPHSTMTLVVSEEGFSFYRRETFILLIPFATIEKVDVRSMDEVDLFFNRPDCAWSHYVQMAIQCSSDSPLWKLLRTPELTEAKGLHFVVAPLWVDV